MFALLALITAALPVEGAVAFVAAPTTALQGQAARAGVAGTSTALALPIWTAVWVERLEGPRALVRVGPRTLLYASPGAEPQPVAPLGRGAFPADAPVGFVAVADLDTAPPTRRALLEQARRADPITARALLDRARALDPHDPDVAALVEGALPPGAPPRAAAASMQADLVYGCRGDITRAALVTGTVATLGAARAPLTAPDACAVHVDVRPPCALEAAQAEADDFEDEVSDDGADDGADGAHVPAATRPAGPQLARPSSWSTLAPSSTETAAVRFKADLARFVPRFGAHGPALRVRVSGALPRPMFVVTHLVEAQGCEACTAQVAATDVRLERLRVPIPGTAPTTLHVLVPRYVGALYDIVTAEDASDVDAEAFTAELREAFDADPRERHDEDDVTGHHLFVAPAACCACD